MRRGVATATALGLGAAAAGCAAVLGFEDRSPRFCVPGEHVRCEDFDQPGPVAGEGRATGAPPFDRPGKNGRALGAALAAQTSGVGESVVDYPFNDPRLPTASSLCVQMKMFFEHAIDLVPRGADAGQSPDEPFGKNALLVLGLDLVRVPNVVFPVALGFGIKHDLGPGVRSPFVIGYSSDGGDAAVGPALADIMSVGLDELPTNQWIGVAIRIDIVAGSVTLAIDGVAHALPPRMRTELWNRAGGGSVFVGARAYDGVGAADVRIDELVVDVDVPCP